MPKKSFPLIMVSKNLPWRWQAIVLLLFRRHCWIMFSWCPNLNNLKSTVVSQSFSYFVTKSRCITCPTPMSSIQVLTTYPYWCQIWESLFHLYNLSHLSSPQCICSAASLEVAISAQKARVFWPIFRELHTINLQSCRQNMHFSPVMWH